MNPCAPVTTATCPFHDDPDASSSCSSPSSFRGFTLIELLVVIAIITILIGLIMPVVRRAREVARSTACLSNQRQLFIACAAYVGEHDGTFPIAFDYGGSISVGIPEWDFWRDRFFNPTEVRPGVLWQGQTNVEVHQCPSFDGPANSPGDPYTGYNYNTSYLGGFRLPGFVTTGSDPARGWTESARVDQVIQPTRCAVFGDGEWSGGANKFMRAPRHDAPRETSDDSVRAAATQGFRHAGATTNVVMADGHGYHHQSRFTDGPAGVADGTGFLSEDNALYDLGD